MLEHWFYHCKHSPLDAVLPDILEKTYAKGWRAVVRIGALAGDPQSELGRWDRFLWAYKKSGFLPHGRDDEPLADRQPVLLSSADTPVENRDVIILISGAEIPECTGVKRCITMFEDGDEAGKTIARTRWKSLTSAGEQASYWSQNDHGKWIQPLG